MYDQKPEIPYATLLEWKNKWKQLINHRIMTLKSQKSNKYPTGTSSQETTFIKKHFQRIRDQFVVAPIDKANENVAFTEEDVQRCF